MSDFHSLLSVQGTDFFLLSLKDPNNINGQRWCSSIYLSHDIHEKDPEESTLSVGAFLRSGLSWMTGGKNKNQEKQEDDSEDGDSVVELDLDEVEDGNA